MKKYFSIYDVIRKHPKAFMFIIVGRRGCGKSYSIKKYCIDRAVNHSSKFVYIRFWDGDFKGAAKTIFDDVSADSDVKQWLATHYPEVTNHFIQISGGFVCVFGTEEHGKVIKVDDIGVCASLNKSTRFKGSTWLGYENLFLDEFIDPDCTAPSWRDDFDRIMWTVARSTNDIRIFLAGNPDNHIELSPFVQDLHLDYDRMDPNTEYLFSTFNEDGSINEEGKVFVKLASADEDEVGGFLDPKTYGIWGQAANLMSFTGEVDCEHFIKLTTEQYERFQPMVHIDCETAIVKNDNYHQNIHIYIGTLDGTPFIYTNLHKVKKFAKVLTLYSRFDKEKWVDRPYRQIYRLDIPSKYSFKKLFSEARQLQTIATPHDPSAQWMIDVITQR